jgi:cyclophilin family peptidyl-prolyl cis-trans isomerase
MQDSRFFITTSPYASWADERYSAFGYVSKGMDFVRGLSILPTTPPSNYPNTRIRIVDSGVY